MYFKQKNLGTLHSCKDLKDNTVHIFYKDQIYRSTLISIQEQTIQIVMS